MAIRFVTVGTSMITGQFIEALQFCADAEFLGAYSRSAQKAESYTQEHGGTKSYSSLEAVCADTDVDAVYIASPNYCHKQQALQCIAAHKHVLIEKPLALTQQDATEILDAARAQNVVAMEGMRLVHDPGYAAIKQALPRIGEIQLADLHYCKHSSRYDDLLNGELPNIFNPQMAGGAMMDLGIYPIEAALYLFGSPLDVEGFSVTHEVIEDQLIDFSGAALFKYDALVASVRYSKAVSSSVPCSILGYEGEIEWDGVSQPRHAKLRLRDDRTETIDLGERQNKTDHEVGNLEFEVQDFVAHIQNHTEPTQANKISVAAIAIMESLRAQEGIVFPSE